MTRRLLISDHALLRYLQREHSINVEAAREEIARKCEPAAMCGAKSITAGKCHFVFGAAFENGNRPLVTVLTAKMHSNDIQKSYERKRGTIDGARP